MMAPDRYITHHAKWSSSIPLRLLLLMTRLDSELTFCHRSAVPPLRKGALCIGISYRDLEESWYLPKARDDPLVFLEFLSSKLSSHYSWQPHEKTNWRAIRVQRTWCDYSHWRWRLYPAHAQKHSEYISAFWLLSLLIKTLCRCYTLSYSSGTPIRGIV